MGLLDIFKPKRDFKIEIDETKPLYIVRSKFSIIYYHMESYDICKPMWYPLEGTNLIWKFEYDIHKADMLKLGLDESAIPTFEEWVLKNHVGPDKLYKKPHPPKITHECKIFTDSEPKEYDNCDFLRTLVKERYPQYFN